MLPTKPKLLKTVMSPEVLAYRERKILEIKILAIPETGPLAPKKQDLALLDSAPTKLPTVSPIP
jgi:hypothetical protein